MQFETILDLFGLARTVDSVDSFYKMLIPQLFESLNTTANLSWKKVDGRFQASFELDGMQYVIRISREDPGIHAGGETSLTNS
jgi:hypothetical protein